MASTSEQDQVLRKYSVDEIEAMYRDHEIYASERNWMLREKARVTLRDTIASDGTVSAMAQRMLSHAGEGWEKIRDAATDKPLNSLGGPNLYNAMMALWGSVQIYGAATEGLGEVLGMNAEDLALSYGVSPGLARFINSATYWFTQFAPVGVIAKVGVKAGEKALPGISGKLAAEASKSKLSKESIEELHVLRAFADGLRVEGVKQADEFVEAAAQSAFKTDTASILKSAREAEPVAAVGMKMPGEVPMSFLETAKRWEESATVAEAREALPALMRKFGISYPDLIAMHKAGQPAMSATQFYGHLKALEDHGRQLSRLARQATREGATQAEHAAFMRYAVGLFTGTTDRNTLSTAFQEFLVHWAPAQVAAGDIRGAMKVFAEDMARLSVNNAGKLIRKGNLPPIGGAGGGVLINAPSSPSISGAKAAARTAMNASKPPFTVAGMVREGFSNLLLPLSWPAATIGNVYAVGRTVADRLVGRTLEGHPIHAVSEAFIHSKAMMFATGDALKAGWWEYAHSPSRNVIPGIAGRVVNAQRDTLVAIDSATKLTVWRGLIYADALKQAHDLGVKNVGRFVNNFVANPPQQFVTRAWEQAQRATFSNDLGGIAARMTAAAQSGPGYLYFTFVKSGINLYKYAWHNTPGMQLLSLQLAKDIAAGGQRASDAAARLTIASLTGAMFFELAKDGWITGSGPANPRLRKSWQLTHEPVSIRSSKDGRWFPFSRMEPISQPLGFTADVASIADQLDDMTYKQAMMAITYAWVHNFANVTMWRQATELIDVINGTGRGERLTERDIATVLNPAITVASGGPLVARTARVLDPIARDQRTLLDRWKARIPGKTDEVPPLRDGLGDVIVPPSTVGTRWFGYIQPLVLRAREPRTDRVAEEAARLQATLPHFRDAIGQGDLPDDWDITTAKPGEPIPVGITPRQRDRWQQIYSNMVRGAGNDQNPGLERGLLDTETYQTAPLALQREMFNNFVAKAKSLAGRALIIEDSELMRKLMQAKFQSAVPKLSVPERGALATTIVEELSTYDSLAPQERDNLLQFGILAPDRPVVDPTDSSLTIYHPMPSGEQK